MSSIKLQVWCGECDETHSVEREVQWAVQNHSYRCTENGCASECPVQEIMKDTIHVPCEKCCSGKIALPQSWGAV